MTLTRFVEIGRIGMINYGPEYGKLLCIVDILDGSRVIAEALGETRCQISLKSLCLTGLKIDIPRKAKAKLVKKKMLDDDVIGKFALTAWGKKIALRKSKMEKSDFERFRTRHAREEHPRPAINKWHKSNLNRWPVSRLSKYLQSKTVYKK
jgi:large subunit ribosomal protein L14e